MLRFGAVGVTCLIVSVVIMDILMKFGAHYFPAAVAGTGFSLVANFFLLEWFVFHDLKVSARAFWKRLTHGVAFNAISSLAQLGLLAALVEFLNLWPIAGQVISIGVIFVVKFLFTSKVIYAPKRPAEELDRAEIGGAAPKVVGSPSIDKPDYWWFVVRGRLLEKLMGKYVTKEDRILDIGSADGPSAEWLNDRGWKVSSDIDPRGLKPEDNGIVSNALAMPFRDESFTVVSAFDVIEHIDPEQGALDEFYRVLQPGGRALISVPAYQWAWTSFDVFNCHHRRYTKKRLREAMERSGFEVERLTYGFFGTFPFFAADRLKTRFSERGKKFDARGEGVLPPLPEISPLVEKILFAFSKLDEFLINRVSLPFGSSVMVVARKKG